MRKQNRAAACFRRKTAKDVLPEGVVGTALRRGAVNIAPPRVGGENIAVPLLDGIRRIG